MSKESKAVVVDVLCAMVGQHVFRIKYFLLRTAGIVRVARLLRCVM